MYENEPELMLEQARALVAQGISVIPTGGGISPKAKQPHHQALKATGHFYLNAQGQQRSSWKALQGRLPTDDELQSWYLQHRARGIGFVTGKVSGFIAVDVDSEGLTLASELGWHPHVITPSGGLHFYLRHPGWYVPSNASKNQAALPPGFDIRGDGGYCMFPPSRNRQGQYQRTAERRLLQIEEVPLTVTVNAVTYQMREALGLIKPARVPRDLPAPVVAALPGEAEQRVPVRLMLERAAEYAPVSRNRGAFMFGLWMNANAYSLEEALQYTGEYARRVGDVKPTPFTSEEAAGSIRSAFRYPRNEPWTRQNGK